MQKPIAITVAASPRFSFHPGLALAYVLAFGFFLIANLPEMLAVPCPWKISLGIACPSCGTGRCLTALMEWRFADAFFYNPLFFLTLLFALFLVALWLMQLATGRTLRFRLSTRPKKLARYATVAMILLNYAYLLYFEM